jgi:acetolactate synthase I/II/III large subunit
MKVSDFLAEFLAAKKVPAVFEMSGGMITHMLDSIGSLKRTRIVSLHHEQAAAFAADALGRMTGTPGVAMATSGPGATNLLTGIGSCYFDSSPAVFITGQVNRHEQKGERAIRQLGFQETDIVSMAKPITKAAWQVLTPEDIPSSLKRAFALAVEGRPGPVLVDIPMDIQRSDISPGDLNQIDVDPSEDNISCEQFVEDLVRHLSKSKRPLILVGGGIRSSRSTPLFRQVLAKLRIPTVHSLMGVDILPYKHPLRIGMIGSYGNRWANLAIGQSDLLLVLGSRLDIRQTGADTKSFKGERMIFHVDCETGELNNRITGCIALRQELGSFFAHALHSPCFEHLPDYSDWLREIETLRVEWPDTGELKLTEGINPNVFMHELSQVSHAAFGFIVDVGQHQMWAAQSLELQPGQRFLTSGGMGSMGFALPAAIGASFAAEKRPAVVIAGDGGFQSNIQELQTVARNGLPLKIVILNNQCHGMVRQFQESYFEGRYQSTYWGYSAPNFEKVSRAYEIDSQTVENPAKVVQALEWLWSTPDRPALLQVMIDTHANAYPKIAFGRAMTEMEPLAKPVEMEGT